MHSVYSLLCVCVCGWTFCTLNILFLYANSVQFVGWKCLSSRDKMSSMYRNVFLLLCSTSVVALLVNLMENVTDFKGFFFKRCPSLMSTCERTIRTRVESKQTNLSLFHFSLRQASGSSLRVCCLQNAVSRPASLFFFTEFVYRSIIFYPFPLINSDVRKQRSTTKRRN